jgi:hypothetical protein
MDDLSKFEYISWGDYHRLTFQMAQEIEKRRLRLDKLVVISRGGAVVGRLLSDFLELPIRYITIVAYGAINKPKKPKIVEGLNTTVDNETVLLVDEIADSGATFKTAIEHLRKHQAAKIYTAALIIKPHTQPRPDFYTHTSDKWVVFPYEVRETISQLASQWQKEGNARKEIVRKLVKLGFVEAMVRVIVAKK